MAKEQYENLSDDAVEFLKKIEKSFVMPVDIKFVFLSKILRDKFLSK